MYFFYLNMYSSLYVLTYMFLIFIKNFFLKIQTFGPYCLLLESMIAYVYLKDAVWKFKEYHAILSAR